ncbi:hypothetical protein H2203_005293 [Taxawa tesnikishii (nom. ined.)]|nr:hypothetical protein H2203_005293 [Dothideales sp. JES 119]
MTSSSPHVADAAYPLLQLQPEDLPYCPKCKSGLLRPAVIWYGETPAAGLDLIDKWLGTVSKIDLMLIVGTAAGVYPANEYIDEARERRARVAIFNTAPVEQQFVYLQQGDWYFQGDTATLLPELLGDAVQAS